MAIEKLGITEIAHRVWIAEVWGNDEPSLSEGHLVTAAVRETARVARAREDALLEALNMMLDSAVPHPIEHPTMTKAWNHTREVIRQIEGSR